MTLTKLLPLSLLLFTVACKKKTPEPAPKPAPEPVEEVDEGPVAKPPAKTPAPVAKPLREGFGPVVPAVHFESGVMTVAASEMSAVDAAADVLKNEPKWKVIVVGLADASGDAAMNKELSQKRADAVAAELKKKAPGSAARIVSKGIGEKLATGQAQSERKVEFVFYEDKGLPIKQVVMQSGVLEADFRAKRATK
jgi:outer membrane protein OmpA-like peptidoglycan-associated protein